MIRTARILLIASLALWTGGLATISFVLAPTAFRVARPVAGQIVGASLRTFGKVEIVCGILAAASAIFLRWKTGRGKLLVGLALAMLLVSLSYVSYVYPQAADTRIVMEQRPEDAVVKDQFALLHRVSVILVSINILLGAASLAVASGSRNTDGA